MTGIAPIFQQPAFGTRFQKPGVLFGNEENPRQFHSQVPTDPEPTRGTVNSQGKPLNFVQRVFDKMIRWYRRNEFIHGTLYKPRYVNLFGRKWMIYGGLQCLHKKNGVSELSCSEYGSEAIREKGAVKGTMLTVGRVMSCNPWMAKQGSKIGQRFSKVI